MNPGDTIEGFLSLDLKDDVEGVFNVEFSNSGGVVSEDSDFNMSSWVQFPTGSSLSVLGADVYEIPIVLSVPDKVSPGDYIGAFKIFFEEKSAEDNKAETDNGVVGVSMQIAYGEKLRISIVGDRVHGAELHKFDLVRMTEKDDGKVEFEFQYEVSVKGNTFIQPKAKIVLTDVFNNEISVQEVNFGGMLMPGKVENRRFVVQGGDKFFGWINVGFELNYSIYKDGDIDLSVDYPLGGAELKVYSIPLIYILIFVTLFLILFSFFIFHYYRLNSLRSLSKVYTIKQGDTLQSVCQRFNARSKDLIIVNHLKQPYFLEVGKTLLIPKK